MADLEDATSDIPALVQHLRSRRRAEQLRAVQQLYAVALSGSVSECAAIAAAGAIPPLVQLMSSSSNAVRAAACGTLADVICAQNGEDTFMAAGDLAPLHDCLFRCADQDVQSRAALLATNLLIDENPRCAECHAALADGIPTLVSRLGGEGGVPAATAGLLRNLCGSSAAGVSANVEHEAAVAAGAVPALARLLARGNEYEQRQALSALANLAYGVQDAIAAEGLIPTFVERLSNQDQEMQRWAAMAAHNMLRDIGGEPSQHCEALAAAGAIPHLVRCLANGSEETRRCSAWALHYVCRDRPERCGEAEAAGAVAALQRMQQSSDERVQRAASRALHTLQSTAAAAALPSASEPAPTARQPAAAASTRRRPPAPRICAAPGSGATHGLRRCGGCGTVRYCGEACSRAHWREHRAECRRLQAEQAAAAAAGPSSGP